MRILGDPSEFKETLAGLDAAAPFLRGLLGRSLHVRRIPELRFREDRSMEHARRIEQLLSDVVVPEDDTGEAADSETAEEGTSAEDEDPESMPASSE